MIPVVRALALSIAVTFVAAPVLAQNKSISKSVSDGWDSVIKDASKAAKAVSKSVSKAANDAMAPKKTKKRRASKKNEPEAAPERAAKPETEKGKQATRQPDVEDGPPVPLTRQFDSLVKKNELLLKREATPAKRLPPPPPAPAVTSPAKSDATWSAKSKDDAEPEGTPPSVVAPGAKPLPITMIPPKEAEAAPKEAAWSKEEIETAKANCAALLKGLDATTIPEGPVREGGCGAPAPVRLVSIGKNPEVALSPPPLVTCEVVAALFQWMKNDIQPLSKKTFSSPVIKIETMSDYSCRMAYGRKGNKLSEHGKANALDIRGFITAKGEAVYVLEQWGKTDRDRKAEAAALAAQKAAAEKATAAAATAGSKTALDQQTATAKASLAQASLGGPALKPKPPTPDQAAAAAIVPDEPRGKKSQFLHDAHTSACRIFGTSLGPESNEAHRNHFHVDMAERKRTKICE